MRQILINQNPLVKDLSGTVIQLLSSESYLPTLKLVQGYNAIEIPFSVFQTIDDVSIIAEPAETIMHKGVIVVGTSVTRDKIRVFIYNIGGAISLRSGEPLVNLKFVTVNRYRQVEQDDSIKIVGAVAVEREAKKSRKTITPRKTTKKKT